MLYNEITNGGYDIGVFHSQETIAILMHYPADDLLKAIIKSRNIKEYNTRKDRWKYFLVSVTDNENRFSSLMFLIGNSNLDYHLFRYAYSLFGPSISPLVSTILPKQDVIIEEVLNNFGKWLDTEVREYVTEKLGPDLWKQAEAYRDIINSEIIRIQDATTFSQQEKLQIRIALPNFRRLLESNYNPTAEQLRDIDTRLNYIDEAIDRLNKFDWQGVLLSTMLGIIMTLTLDTERGRQLWNLLMQALSQAKLLLR